MNVPGSKRKWRRGNKSAITPKTSQPNTVGSHTTPNLPPLPGPPPDHPRTSFPVKKMSPSTDQERQQHLLKWAKLNHQTDESSISASDFVQFATTYPLSNSFPFLARQSTDRDIEVDDGIEPWTYFHAHCPGLGVNVPIPLHPKLVCQMFRGSTLQSRCIRSFAGKKSLLLPAFVPSWRVYPVQSCAGLGGFDQRGAQCVLSLAG